MKDKINLKLIVDISLLILLLLFVLQNLESITVKILFIKLAMPLFIIIAVSFGIGYYTGVVFGKGKKE